MTDITELRNRYNTILELQTDLIDPNICKILKRIDTQIIEAMGVVPSDRRRLIQHKCLQAKSQKINTVGSKLFRIK